MGHNDEEIIELTEIVTKEELKASRVLTQSPTPTDDQDDIIALTDIVEPQSERVDTMAAAAPVMDDEDRIIELTDIVEPQSQRAEAMAAAAPAMDDEDDIIELTDIVEPETADEEWAQLTLSELTDPDAEEVTGQLPDTNEYFEKQHQSVEETLSELESMMDDTFSGQEGLLELNDVLEDQNEPKAAFDAVDDEVSEEAATDLDSRADEDFPIGIALDEITEDQIPDLPPPSLTNEQIDAALERLIQTKYGQSIEQFIAASIEKIVTKQIESLRQSLLEDDGPID